MAEMTEEKKIKGNFPNLRFPEFEGEWEEKKLGEDCDILMCKRIFAIQTSNLGEVPFYKIGTIGGTPDAYISKELHDEYKEQYNYPQKGELLITCAGTVGKCTIFDGKDAYFQDSNIVWISNPKEQINNNFLYYYISQVDWGKLNSTTITRIYNDNLRNLLINYPITEEQNKIVSFLSLIDQRIKTQNKIIEELKLLKSVFGKNIFQETKFDSVDKLKDLCRIRTGKLDANAMIENGVYPFFTCAKEVFKINDYAFDTEALLISGNGANVGYIHYYNGRFNAYQRTYVLDNFNCNVHYINFFLQFMLPKRIEREKSIGNTPYIVLGTLADMEIRLPSNKIQEKIVRVLSAIDKKIKVEELIQKNYIKQNQYLLRELFI